MMEERTIYMISPSISILRISDIPDDPDDPFLMVKDGSVISTLNYTAGILLLLVSKGGMTLDEIFVEVESQFLACEEMRKDFSVMLESFLARKWVIKCQL